MTGCDQSRILQTLFVDINLYPYRTQQKIYSNRFTYKVSDESKTIYEIYFTLSFKKVTEVPSMYDLKSE